MGLWVRAHATVKNMGSMGDSDAEKGGLLSLTYASPPEWDCPPGFCNLLTTFCVGLPCSPHQVGLPCIFFLFLYHLNPTINVWFFFKGSQLGAFCP